VGCGGADLGNSQYGPEALGFDDFIPLAAESNQNILKGHLKQLIFIISFILSD
jgi:hypothetical protein